MKSQYVKNVELNQLLDLGGEHWSRIKPDTISLTPTPIDLQPTPIIRQEWEKKSYGAVKSVELSSAHNGRFIAFRMHWSDTAEDLAVRDNNRFVDAAAIMLEGVPGAPIQVMGAEGKPVNVMYWRADEGKTGRNVIAEGIGTSRTIDTEMIVCNPQWDSSSWTLIIARPLLIESEEKLAQLAPGQELPYAVAIWEGSGGERAGIKAFGVSPSKLVIEKAA